MPALRSVDSCACPGRIGGPVEERRASRTRRQSHLPSRPGDDLFGQAAVIRTSSVTRRDDGAAPSMTVSAPSARLGVLHEQ
ncbi:hypothetical protein HNR09_001093 [Nesterenkonia xinjiangensis]|uniref:Uncharacterized protein n=1 Tax=Nesterenkonia xinjiangensis TaxID=225327 RepID=A0A7Z0GKM4_9MICC|nr:hypothetical protein [Nesterenkonia xinjiangensis]